MSVKPKSSKKPECFVKLQIQAGKANPAPPVGTALGPRGVNIMEFCKAFNAESQVFGSSVVTAILSVYKDKTFTFIIKSPPVPVLIKEKLKLTKCAKDPGRSIVAKISAADVKEIAEKKMVDMNTPDLNAAISMVVGTAKSMGIELAQ